MSEFTAKEQAPVAMPPKNRKLLVISISLLMTIIVGGAVWFFGKNHNPAAAHTHSAEARPPAVHDAKFIPLGEDFMVSLQHEEDGDQYLQTAITLKTLQPELEAKIKAMMPEIRDKLTAVLSSKKPSELLTADGKKRLTEEIITETNALLGLGGAPAVAASAREGGANTGAAASALAIADKTTGVVDVVFTSFIVQ